MCLRMLISADDGDLQAFASAITAMSTVGIDSIDIFMCQSVDLASIVGVGHADSNVSARLLVGEIPNAVVEEDGDSWRVYLPVDNENDDDVVCASFDTSLLDSAFRCSPAMGIEHDRHGYDKVSTARTLLLSLRYYRDEKDNVVSFSRAVIEDSPSRSVVTEILASSTAITNDLHAEPSYGGCHRHHSSPCVARSCDGRLVRPTTLTRGSVTRPTGWCWTSTHWTGGAWLAPTARQKSRILYPCMI